MLQIGVSWGWGTGWLRKPQGYPWRSLDLTGQGLIQEEVDGGGIVNCSDLRGETSMWLGIGAKCTIRS